MISNIAEVFYLVISFGITVWLGQILKRTGYAFLSDMPGQLSKNKAKLGDVTSQVLALGFYLCSAGVILLSCEWDKPKASFAAAARNISGRLGRTLFVFAVLHVLSLLIFELIRYANGLAHKHTTDPELMDPVRKMDAKDYSDNNNSK